MNEQPNNQNPHFDRHGLRQARRANRAGRSWASGIILVALGVILLLQNQAILTLNNWWALFILLPALGSFATAWEIYQASGHHWSLAARGALVGGVGLTMVTAIFLFELNWMIYGPILLILLGAAMLLNPLLPE